jgi:hypothetical protein
MFGKPVDALTLADLQILIRVAEGQALEFKAATYGRNDEDVREMLRDVSAMANASGGLLLIGVETDADERATSLVGIPDTDEEVSRMLQSMNANLDERIVGLSARAIPLTADRAIAVFEIPQSLRAPHMITFRGLNQFWRRYGTHKGPMRTEEVRDACMRVENLWRSAEDFIAERRAALIQGVPHGAVTMVLTATPAIVKGELLDPTHTALKAVLRTPPNQRDGGFNVPRGENQRPTLQGIRVRGAYGHLEVFRNGHVECVTLVTMTDDVRHVVNPCALSELVGSFTHVVRAVHDLSDLRQPVVVTCTLANAQATSLETDFDVRGPAVTTKAVEVPPAQFPTPLQPGEVAHYLADRLWNAFGFEKCEWFNADHEWHNRQV